MHHIQKNIILNLARTSPLRFTELQPPRIPNNSFSYHLKKLIDGGYVELTGNGYTVTRKALKLTVFGGINNTKTPSTPKMITMLYIENSDGEVLLINRNQRPFHGRYKLPSGLIHQGETLDQAACREMLEKTTIVASSGGMQRVGVLDSKYVEQGTEDIFVHTVGFVYKYKFEGDKHLLNNKTTRYGELLWSKLDRDDILPEAFTVHELIQKGEFGYESATFDEPPQPPAAKPSHKTPKPRKPKPARAV